MASSAPVLSRRRPCIVLGVAPAVVGEPWSVGSASGRRLADLAGIDLWNPPCAKSPAQVRLERAFGLDNLVPYPEPTRQALRDAAALYRFLPSFWYVLAGTEVVRALGKRVRPAEKNSRLPWSLSCPPPLVWYETREGVVCAVLPHPSGRNRWYNDKRCHVAAEKFLREARWARSGVHALWERAREASR